MVAFTMPHGEHAASTWPRVVACSTRGCVMRAPADLVAQPWVCREHRDPYADTRFDALMADMLARQAHAELVEPSDTTYTDPPRQRRYQLQTSPRLSPDWRPDDASQAS